jgi:hypothetical protein
MAHLARLVHRLKDGESESQDLDWEFEESGKSEKESRDKDIADNTEEMQEKTDKVLKETTL